MLPEREAKLSDEALEARAQAYMEASTVLNEMAGWDCHGEVEAEQFYSVGKEMWMKYTHLKGLLEGRNNGQGTRAASEALPPDGSGAGASAAHG